jgi:hypothetical protein
MDAPVRIALQTLGNESLVIHNYNKDAAQVELSATSVGSGTLVNGFTGENISDSGGKLSIKLEPRSRIWVKNQSK